MTRLILDFAIGRLRYHELRRRLLFSDASCWPHG